MPYIDINKAVETAALEICRDENVAFSSMIAAGVLPHRCVSPEGLLKLVENGLSIKDSSIITGTENPDPRFLGIVKEQDDLRIDSVFSCEGIPPSHMCILRSKFADTAVFAIRQSVTCLPIYSVDKVGFVIYEEIGLGIFDRTKIVTVEINTPKNYVREL